MLQSRWQSLLETCVSTSVGFGVALLSQLVLFPLYGIHVTFSTDLILTTWFTIISILRGYLLRRLFNAWLRKQASKL